MKRHERNPKPWRLMTPTERIAAIVDNKRRRDSAVKTGYIKLPKTDGGK